MARILLICAVLVAGVAVLCSAGGFGGDHHKKYIIHVPVHYKHHHHTHTIVKHVYHKAEKPEYKFLGYTHGHDEGHGSSGSSDDGGNGLSHGYDMSGFEGHSSTGDNGGGYEEHAEISYGGGHGGHEETGESQGHGWE